MGRQGAMLYHIALGIRGERARTSRMNGGQYTYGVLKTMRDDVSRRGCFDFYYTTGDNIGSQGASVCRRRLYCCTFAPEPF